jgi:hypothetical protein
MMVTRKDNVMGNEQRRNPRIETSNLVDYTLFDREHNPLGNGKGLTMNLSQNGLLLKTQKALNGTFVLLMAIDLEGNIVQVEGRLVYSSRQESSGYYMSGVEFTGPKDQQLQAIVTFVKAYQHKKHHQKR